MDITQNDMKIKNSVRSFGFWPANFIAVSLTPGFSPVSCGHKELGAASAALTHCGKPLKRLWPSSPVSTGLKPGVNERSRKKCEISGQASDFRPPAPSFRFMKIICAFVPEIPHCLTVGESAHALKMEIN
jgi:hypothetical protein